MKSFEVPLTISVLACAIICTIAAPAIPIIGNNISPVVRKEPLAEFIDNTPKPINRDTPPSEEEAKPLERFFRIYEDGTIEFKIVLSNGVAQFQKITNKIVGGKTIQVQEGYSSELLPDKTYRTTFYIADENGYRIRRREFDTKPPVLPAYVPHVPTVTKCDI